VERRTDLQRISIRLHHMSRNEGLFLLHASLGVPRLHYLICTAPCIRSPEVVAFHGALWVVLFGVTNCHLSDMAWGQASLPVQWGGLGVRSLSSLAVSAYLASTVASAGLVGAQLPSCFILRSLN